MPFVQIPSGGESTEVGGVDVYSGSLASALEGWDFLFLDSARRPEEPLFLWLDLDR